MKPISAIFAIAQNTFYETVRDKILYAFVLFAFLMTAAGCVLGSLSVGQDLRVLEDIGLAVIGVIGGIISIFIGTTLVYKEIERRTIYLIVTKPIRRWQFVLGKFLGLSFLVLVISTLMGAFLLAMVWWINKDHVVNLYLIESVALIYLEILFVTALATFFSTFTTPILSVLLTFGIWIAGHLSSSMRALAKLSEDPSVAKLFDTIYWFLPDLAKLTQIRAELMYARQPDGELLIFLVSYIVAYVLLLLCFATIIMENREFAS